MLESSKVEWSRTPFQFEDMWLTHHRFLELVAHSWGGSNVRGWARFEVMGKLKEVKEKLKKCGIKRPSEV